VERRDLGWEDPQTSTAIVVTGSEFETEKDQEWWDFVLGHPQVVFARVSAQQKLQVVEQAQRLGHIVGVVGAGIQDSPAIKKADVGIAMGESGHEVRSHESTGGLLNERGSLTWWSTGGAVGG
jgi:sodium/potassium-transporting ATPase subunit alpha